MKPSKLLRLRKFPWICSLALLSASWIPAHAQQPAVVKASIVLSTDVVHPGALAHAKVIARIAPGYHVNSHHPSVDYAIPTELKIRRSPEASLASVHYPEGHPRKFAFENKPLSVYEGRLTIEATLRIASSAHPGNYVLHGLLSYQACNDQACLPPASIPLSLTFRVAPQSVRLKPSNSAAFKR